MAWCRCRRISCRWCCRSKIEITQQGGSPLARVPEFVNVTCPKCGGPARRETDTMDTFVDSSWYFYRYTDAKNVEGAVRSGEGAVLVSDRPVHRRRGARDSAPDLFALLDEGDARPGPGQERRAGARLFTQGMVIKDGAKMSKSKGNVVSPDDMVARYGADATRMYALFAAPPDRDLDWQEDGVAGVSRFLGRVWRLVTKHAPVARAGAVAQRSGAGREHRR